MQSGGARPGPAAGVAGAQGVGDGLVNRSRRGFGRHDLNLAVATRSDRAEGIHRDRVGVRGRPRHRGAPLLVDLIADLVVTNFRRRYAERSGNGSVDVYRGVGSVNSTRPGGGEFITRGLLRLERLIAGGATAAALRVVAAAPSEDQVRRADSPQLTCAGEAENWPVTFWIATSALAMPAWNRGSDCNCCPRGQATVLRTPLKASTTNALIGRHVDAGGPGIMIGGCHRQLMLARGHDEFLLPILIRC